MEQKLYKPIMTATGEKLRGLRQQLDCWIDERGDEVAQGYCFAVYDGVLEALRDHLGEVVLVPGGLLKGQRICDGVYRYPASAEEIVRYVVNNTVEISTIDGPPPPVLLEAHGDDKLQRVLGSARAAGAEGLWLRWAALNMVITWLTNDERKKIASGLLVDKLEHDHLFLMPDLDSLEQEIRRLPRWKDLRKTRLAAGWRRAGRVVAARVERELYRLLLPFFPWPGRDYVGVTKRPLAKYPRVLMELLALITACRWPADHGQRSAGDVASSVERLLLAA